MSRFRHHKYTWSKPFGSARHNWELVGPDGAVHFSASVSERHDPACGLEFHHTRAVRYRCDEAPDHLDCPLTGGPCWHDGTSLYASEHVWPVIEPMLRSGDHETIFRVLEGEYDEHFNRLKGETP